ncbi:MAG: gloB [Bacteriovoracaceae bacterium]|nr:gloB [Bacteriovoracaceae bacterium]
MGGKKDAHRIPGINLQLSDQEIFKFGAMNATILEVPGHTLGAIAYFFESEEALFTGDTLFSLGCGRLFEGTAEQMFSSLNKIKSLPPKTQIYCGHEYTEKNCRFALSLDPESQKLKDFHKRILARREENRPTLPAILADELRLNPFLNCDLQQFKERRRLRDQF